MSMLSSLEPEIKDAFLFTFFKNLPLKLQSTF